MATFLDKLLARIAPRPVVDSMPGFGTAKSVGRAMREGVAVDIEGQPLFFRDLPSEEAQHRITQKLGHPQGRVFTPDEIKQIEQASAVNKGLNDEVLGSLQELYNSHDPRVLAGMALVGALSGGGLAMLLRPGGPSQQAIEPGAA